MNPTPPQLNDDLVSRLLSIAESDSFEVKRVGENRRAIETIVAFSNSEGGLLVLGLEDADKASGRERVVGVQEKPEAVDELRRLLVHRVTPLLADPFVAPPRFVEIGCTLRDGALGSLMVVQVDKSTAVHSVVDGGTFVRLSRSNRNSPPARSPNSRCSGASRARSADWSTWPSICWIRGTGGNTRRSDG